MPLSKIQIEILRTLATHRNPESYVAGSTPLNRTAVRYSADIDVFHDREERVALAAEQDSAALVKEGYSLQWLRREPAIYSVLLKGKEGETKLEWVVDSDFRFFPTIRDDIFGYVLHPVDLAMNKVLAAAGRREVRDLIDLLTIQEDILPLGAVAWAAVEKSPGFTPEGLIAEIRRNGHYPAAEWRALSASETLEPKLIMSRLQDALRSAEEFVRRMPTEKAGLLFLEEGKVVQPDPEHLENYETHSGKRSGQWPASGEITAAMFERYKNKN